MLWKPGSQPGSPQGPNKIPAKQEIASRQLSKGLRGWRQGPRTHWGELNSSRRLLFTSKQVVKPSSDTTSGSCFK